MVFFSSHESHDKFNSTFSPTDLLLSFKKIYSTSNVVNAEVLIPVSTQEPIISIMAFFDLVFVF